LKQFKNGCFKLKHCVHGENVVAPARLVAQMHRSPPRDTSLVVDRDINAARVLTARGVAQLVPAALVHPGHLQQLRLCLDRDVRKVWLQQQRETTGADGVGNGGAIVQQ
jgi:hypothetical protein